MAIAFDAATVSSTGTGGKSFTHTPVGVPKGALFLIYTNESTDEITGATYGGVTMNQVADSPVLGVGEAGSCHGFFLGASIPTGAQTAAYTHAGVGNSNNGVIITVTAATAETEVEATEFLNSASQANPSVTLATGVSVDCFCAGVLGSGQGNLAAVTPGSDYTEITEIDYVSQSVSFVRRTINSTGGNVALNWTITADDSYILGVALKETVVVVPDSRNPGSSAGCA